MKFISAVSVALAHGEGDTTGLLQREVLAEIRKQNDTRGPAHCSLYNVGTPALGSEKFVSPHANYGRGKKGKKGGSADQYYLKDLDIKKLYDTIVRVMKTSQPCWPADGPQDGDSPSYAGLFIRTAWHCSGTFRLVDGKATGGCEGGRLRLWPEREWRDNGNLDKARSILAEIKSMPEFQMLSWGDLMTFAGTVAIKESGGTVNKFCFGRVDDLDGRKSIMLGSEGTTQCELGTECVSHFECEEHFQWPEQDPSDHHRCKLMQPNGRQQGSHSVGLIYVYPEGPQLRKSASDYDATAVHQRSIKLSADEVRDTFKDRMGWTDKETVALIGGGHTLGRNHGNCAGTSGECIGKYTKTSGFEGAWTRTPSKWNYDYFEGLSEHEWVATKSPDGQDQWGPAPGDSFTQNTMRLTSDLALWKDAKYKYWAKLYHRNHKRFDKDFAAAWQKLTHRSEGHPGGVYDLEADAGTCTQFDW